MRGRKRIGWLTNGVGPLERETYDDLKGWRWQDVYARLCAMPIGTNPYGTGESRHVFGTNAYDVDTMHVYYKILAEEEQVVYYEGDTHERRWTHLNLTVRSIVAVPTGEAVDPGARPTGAGIWPLLKTFGLEYRKRTRLEFLRSGREIGLAKEILKKCGGDTQLASRLVRSFFSIPLGIAPDDMNFTVFSWHVDKLMAQEATERQWADARVSGAKDAAARKHEPTAEDDAKFHAEAARYREETKGRKEREARKREENAL